MRRVDDDRCCCCCDCHSMKVKGSVIVDGLLACFPSDEICQPVIHGFRHYRQRLSTVSASPAMSMFDLHDADSAPNFLWLRVRSIIRVKGGLYLVALFAFRRYLASVWGFAASTALRYVQSTPIRTRTPMSSTVSKRAH
jgi:hypothetical protein